MQRLFNIHFSSDVIRVNLAVYNTLFFDYFDHCGKKKNLCKNITCKKRTKQYFSKTKANYLVYLNVKYIRFIYSFTILQNQIYIS